MYTTGRFKAIGVSNYEPRHIRDLLAHAAIKPHVGEALAASLQCFYAPTAPARHAHSERL